MLLIPGANTLQPGDPFGDLPVRGPFDGALGRARAAGKPLELESGDNIGQPSKPKLLCRSWVIEAVAHGEDNRPDVDLFEPILLIQVDGLSWAGSNALPARLAVGALFNDVRIGRCTYRWFVGSLLGHEPGLVLAGQVYRAYLRAFVAVDAELGVNVSRSMVHFDREITRQATRANNGAIGHDLDVGMLAVIQEERRDRGPRATISVVRCAAAKHAVVGREHEPELGDYPADAGRRVQKIHLVSRVGQIDGGAHATNTCTDNHY